MVLSAVVMVVAIMLVVGVMMIMVLVVIEGWVVGETHAGAKYVLYYGPYSETLCSLTMTIFQGPRDD